MNASLLAVLNDAERLLVAQTERAELATLDEDAAIEFETRIRRVRDEYVTQYRRNASARVAEHGGRGTARPENLRAAMKAEAFEEALSRVSRRVAALARQSAAQLRAGTDSAGWLRQVCCRSHRNGPQARTQLSENVRMLGARLETLRRWVETASMSHSCCSYDIDAPSMSFRGGEAGRQVGLAGGA